ncbi:MAG: hypothetical protein M1838_003036 [Thelocarpon superellum]|nr:MAG: hypothetical protein M1838_003036 [Thelocarpon superellum]
MAKRKRVDTGQCPVEASGSKVNGVHNAGCNDAVTIQVVTGSYERILHGIIATIPDSANADLSKASKDRTPAKARLLFADTFLFQAHLSAIRCLALSPPSVTSDPDQTPKIILASGANDERINLYHLSAAAPSRLADGVALPSLGGEVIAENPKNRELGSLLHHASSVTALHFPTRSKLLSSAEDNTIAVTRTRDWTMLSVIKAPTPVAYGRPSGDTAPVGGAPAGVNDFAVHPSMKLMLSIGKGEKSMRLWNLVTGKKAGVLTFGREILHGVGEGKWGTGEGRKVEWDHRGEEFAVAFERGVVVFDPVSDSLPTTATAAPGTSIPSTAPTDPPKTKPSTASSIPAGQFLGQLSSSNQEETTSRIKDFQILSLPLSSTSASTSTATSASTSALLVVAGSSDGAIRLWKLDLAKLDQGSEQGMERGIGEGHEEGSRQEETKRGDGTKHTSADFDIGDLLGVYHTANRITCLTAFVMLPPLRGSFASGGKHGSDEVEDEEKDVAKDKLDSLEAEDEQEEEGQGKEDGESADEENAV